MAKIIGGLGTSHIPTIGKVIDNNEMHGPYWEPFVKGIQPARDWMKKKQTRCLYYYLQRPWFQFFFKRCYSFWNWYG